MGQRWWDGGKETNGEVFRGQKGQDLAIYLMCLGVEKWGKGKGQGWHSGLSPECPGGQYWQQKDKHLQEKLV